MHLISLMGQMNAICMRNTAVMNMFRISDARSGLMNSPSFGRGSMNFASLAAADNRLDLEMVKNQTLYKIANAQEEAFEKRQKQESRSRLDLLA